MTKNIMRSNARDFIKRIKELVRDIMPGGIPVPYPGTAIYEEYKDKYGFKDWWLKGEILTSEKLRTSPPLFEKLFFYYDTLKHNFFNYSPKIISEIKKTARLIGRHNLLWYSKQISSFPPIYYLIRELLFVLVLISQALYKLSPKLERMVMRPFWIMATKEEAIVRSQQKEI